MDQKALMERRNSLKRQATSDRSKPIVEDAAHPGAAATLRRISVGHFELKRTESTNDRSAPMMEAGTGVKPSPGPAVMKEIAANPPALKTPEKINDRSEAQIERYPTDVTKRVPPSKAVIAEIKDKAAEIENFNDEANKKRVSVIEQQGLVRKSLVEEVKAWSPFIEEQSQALASKSVPTVKANTNAPLISEIKAKRPSIAEFTDFAARNQATETYRSSVNQTLVNEIHQKRASIDKLTQLHRANSGLVAVE